MFDEVQKWEIRQSKLTAEAREAKAEAECGSCAGPISPGEHEVPVRGKVCHPHCAEDLDVTVTW